MKMKRQLLMITVLLVVDIVIILGATSKLFLVDIYLRAKWLFLISALILLILFLGGVMYFTFNETIEEGRNIQNWLDRQDRIIKVVILRKLRNFYNR